MVPKGAFMAVFNLADFDNHQQIVYCFDEKTGLRAIIAIHSTKLGPALGGTRFWHYESEDDALKDALRLSRGMTYKAALAGLPLGGGKGVIIGDPKTEKTREKIIAYARFIESLDGLFITGEDVGMNLSDINAIYEVTKYVRGRDASLGGTGDPASVTGFGVYKGIKAAVAYQLGKHNLQGVRVAIQGLGHVGSDVTRRLAEDGAVLVVTDIDISAAEEAQRVHGAKILAPDKIFGAEVDVFVPCALGGILNDTTIAQLKCSVVAGSANNQLEHERHAQMLKECGILYAPDYVINAGGLIDVANEGPHYDLNTVMKKVEGIYDTLLHIFDVAKSANITTSEASDRIARGRFKR
jgi:leucine dehydrogenase